MSEEPLLENLRFVHIVETKIQISVDDNFSLPISILEFRKGPF